MSVDVPGQRKEPLAVIVEQMVCIGEAINGWKVGIGQSLGRGDVLTKEGGCPSLLSR